MKWRSAAARITGRKQQRAKMLLLGVTGCHQRQLLPGVMLAGAKGALLQQM
jgi:hypothetical protein